MIALPDPVVQEHGRIKVVRDDLLPGGTKSRYLRQLFARHELVVYATPACGGAQLALAVSAAAAGKTAVLFVAKRREPHQRTKAARAAGARVFQVAPGYLSNVQSKARAFAEAHGAYLLAFGADEEEAIDAIAAAARGVAEQHGPFDEVWSAAGSGTLTRGLQRGISGSKFFAVQVGREVSKAGAAEVFVHPLRFEQELRDPAPFPSCPNYDRKAWQICAQRSKGRVLFWNVMG